MLPSLASGSSSRGKKNTAAAARVKANREAAASGSAGTAQPPIDSSRFKFLPVDEAPKRKRKPGELKLPADIRAGPALHLPHGAKYTQTPFLPPSSVPGKAAIEALLSSRRRPRKDTDVFVSGVDLMFDEDENGAGVFQLASPASAVESRHRRRRLKQHQNWTHLLSIDLLERYLLYKHSQRQRGVARDVQAECSCTRRVLHVTLADWDGTSFLELSVCSCAPACAQLLERGYFPSAPISPSIAFNTALLEFISIHSLNVAPNSTAWSDTLETFWGRRGVPSKHNGRLRKRLAMALTWFQILDNKAESHVSEVVSEHSRQKRRLEDDTPSQRPRKRARAGRGQVDEPDAVSEDGPRQVQSPSKRARVEDAVEQQQSPHSRTPGRPPQGSRDLRRGPDRGPSRRARVEDEAEEPQAQHIGASEPQPQSSTTPPRLQRPSDSLRRKCPLCFGGQRPQLAHTEADVIVCLDANFSQKRRRCADSDPPMEYIDGRFVPPADIAAMEAELEQRRKGKPRRRTRGTSARVADEVLDECEQSFIAAQEKVAKASTNYYADTGLMALLCRHDRVLWVANMTTPGERQHFALALLRKLVQELPDDWRLGVLYDIACQLSRSIEKWGLLPEIADRVTFGVSVFHAYGHQWACQVVFHPRKRAGFGLTDGEGCERFWSAIRHLIAGLRVSGHNRRLFVLDGQMVAMNDAARWTFGVWLRRRYIDARRRELQATRVVEGCDVPEEELAKEWVAQVQAQLKKTPRQSAHGADKAIDEILITMGTVDDLKQEAREVKTALRKVHKMTAAETQQLTTRTEAIQREMASATTRLTTLHASLGTEQCRRLETMRGNAYLRARVNARAVRATIRHALQAHKFERQKLERAYRNQVMHAKDHAQTKNLVHRREKTISAQVRKFNGLVDQMALLAQQGKKPSARTRLPRRLDMKKLFRLDVDDDIWQEDPGLGPQDEGEPPRWQTDPDVKRGILALLEKRRCVEEVERVQAEVRALYSWYHDEEVLLCEVLASTSDSQAVHAALDRRLLTLRCLREVWAADLSICALGSLFAPAVGESTGAATSVLRLDASTPGAEGEPEQVARYEIDSDDASDAYSSGEDEDEPLADMLDELEGAAVDLDVDGDGQSDAEAAGGGPAVEHVPPVAEETEGRSTAEQQTIVISDDSDDDDETLARPRAHRLTTYRVSNFFCDELDVARIVERTGWLSGEGLGVFVRGELQKRALEDISIVHSRALLDVELYTQAVADGEGSVEACLAAVETQLKQLVHPSQARKWLVLGHVKSPPHWTLLEIRWRERKIYFYDSFSRVAGYAAVLEATVRQFLHLCEELLHVELHIDTLEWVPEMRPARQTNSWDCGPFVAADACSLLDSDCPSTKTQKDMANWRKEMEEGILKLRSPGKGDVVSSSHS